MESKEFLELKHKTEQKAEVEAEPEAKNKWLTIDLANKA